jgi:transposase-like protein
MGRERRWGEEKRRELMAAFRRSGVSLRAFAERAGVPYSTMVYWRQRGEPAQEGQRKPSSGQRDRTMNSKQSRSSRNIRWNSGSERGKPGRVTGADYYLWQGVVKPTGMSLHRFTPKQPRKRNR